MMLEPAMEMAPMTAPTNALNSGDRLRLVDRPDPVPDRGRHPARGHGCCHRELIRCGPALQGHARRVRARPPARRPGPHDERLCVHGLGLGLGWEAPWIDEHSHELVEPGMCLAIERRAAVEGHGGTQYEDDVLVGVDGPELLTHTP